jgi:hypothetical protein
MNNNFVFARARELAARLRKEAGEDHAAWVNDGWQIALGRPPSSAEREHALAMLSKLDSQAALDEFCLMLFNLNEFIYVD